jgi:hypothetical protein
MKKVLFKILLTVACCYLPVAAGSGMLNPADWDDIFQIIAALFIIPFYFLISMLIDNI